MKQKPFAIPNQFKRRLIMMVTGILMMGFGLSILMKLQMGTDPCSSFTMGLVNYIPLSFGTIQLLCHLITFAFVIRYNIGMIGFGTIGNMVFLGYTSDFFSWIWNHVLPESFFMIPGVRFGVLLPVLAVFISGAAAYMTAGLGMSPYDALPFMMAEAQTKLSFKTIRMLWDIAFMSAGLVLGGTTGVVTILCAFCIGPVIALFQKKMQIFIKEV